MTAQNPVIVLEVTPRCNLECCYCYNIWKEDGCLLPPELSPPEYDLIAEALLPAEPRSVTLTGGEPLVRDDLSEIVELLSGRGLLLGVATNGTLLDRETADRLVDSGVRWFDISVPSVIPEVYERLTGFDGFGKVKKAMLAAVGAGARLTVSHILTSINFDESRDVVELACAFSADAVVLNRFVPGGAGAGSPNLAPSLHQLDRSLALASKAAETMSMTVYTGIPIEDCVLPHEKYTGISFGSCVCGAEKWAIDPSGGLRTCEQNPRVLGYLPQQSFPDLIEEPSVERFLNSRRFQECGGCSSFRNCGGGCRFLGPAIPNDGGLY